MNPIKYSDRVHAGHELSTVLAHYGGRDDLLVLGLPRGGVPVAAEVARKLGAPLDVIVVRKLGVPGWEELAMGAIAAGGVRVLNDTVVKSARIPRTVIESVTAEQLLELHRREQAYRGDKAPLDVRGKMVILVDDGIATGSTIRAAAQALRKLSPARIVIAAPVGSRESCMMLAEVADEVVVPQQPDDFRAVGQWYANFDQTTDEEVGRLLGKAQRSTPR